MCPTSRAIPPLDAPVNQYTTTPKDSRTYDANGNLLTAVTSAGTRSYTYDYRNMMVGFEDEGGIVSEYRYDALGRRIEKVVDAEGTAVTTRYLHNSRWQVIEERNGSNAVQTTYIHGAWIDETIQMMRGTTASYYLQDDLFSTVGVVDHAGALVETVEYADYGEPLIRNATGLPVSQSTVSNARLFTGREWDIESRLYNYRTRYMDSEAGRFDTRDGIGTWGDRANRGNSLGYAASNPMTLRDPFGRQSMKDDECLEEKLYPEVWGYCGPNIRPKVAAAVFRLERAWKTWSRSKKDKACYSLHPLMIPNPVPGLGLVTILNSWDFEQLGPNSDGPTSSNDRLTCPTKGKCETSVGWNGNCHNRFAVNYLLLGVAYRLCESEFGFYHPEWFDGITIMRGKGETIGDRGDLKKAWALYGYDSSRYPEPDSPLNKKCKPCPMPYTGEISICWKGAPGTKI
jgi:RHS repeat-associated protein